MPRSYRSWEPTPAICPAVNAGPLSPSRAHSAEIRPIFAKTRAPIRKAIEGSGTDEKLEPYSGLGRRGPATTTQQLKKDRIAFVGVYETEAQSKEVTATMVADVIIGWVAHTFRVNFKPIPEGSGISEEAQRIAAA